MAQRVLVSAGASGIGKEIARAFVANDAKVCVCDIAFGRKRTAGNQLGITSFARQSLAGKGEKI